MFLLLYGFMRKKEVDGFDFCQCRIQYVEKKQLLNMTLTFHVMKFFYHTKIQRSACSVSVVFDESPE